MRAFPLWVSLMIGAGVATLPACSTEASASWPSIAVTELDAELKAGKVAQLIDVRTPEEYAGGHVAEAKNLPLDALAARLSELDPNAPVHVICQSGARSQQASALLQEKGFKPVNVSGGTGGWVRAGLPVTR